MDMPLVIGSLSAFDVIPDEIACEIFQHIYATDYCALARVNKRFNSLTTKYKSKVIFEKAKRQFPSIHIRRSIYNGYFKVVKSENRIVSFGVGPLKYNGVMEIWMKIGGILKYIHIRASNVRISDSFYEEVTEVVNIYQ